MYFQQGCEIKAARMLAELDQRGLAKAAGLHRNSVSYWEARNCIPNDEPRAVGAIRKALSLAGVDDENEPRFVITINDRYFGDTKAAATRPAPAPPADGTTP